MTKKIIVVENLSAIPLGQRGPTMSNLSFTTTVGMMINILAIQIDKAPNGTAVLLSEPY